MKAVILKGTFGISTGLILSILSGWNLSEHAARPFLVAAILFALPLENWYSMQRFKNGLNTQVGRLLFLPALWVLMFPFVISTSIKIIDLQNIGSLSETYILPIFHQIVTFLPSVVFVFSLYLIKVVCGIDNKYLIGEGSENDKGND